MKKLVLFSVLTIGAVSASQAGVRFGLDFALPLPPLPGIVISRPAPAPVYASTPAVCEPQQTTVYQAPVYATPLVPAPTVCAPPQTTVYQTPTVVVEQPRTYVEFSTPDCRPVPRYYGRERVHHEYVHSNYRERDRYEHSRGGHRW